LSSFFARFTITYANNLTFATIKVCLLNLTPILRRKKGIYSLIISLNGLIDAYGISDYECRVAAMLPQKTVLKNALQWQKGGWTMSLFDAAMLRDIAASGM
jgi:hypothetical protein